MWKAYFSGFALMYWVSSYLYNSLRGRARPTHIIFCMVDHFEPGTRNVTVDIERERMNTLLNKYPKLAEKHKDSSGKLPKRTWFFPPHYHRNGNLRDLVSLCENGYGEIELHLHHGKTRPDTSENLERTIRQCIEEYSYFGIFGSENGQKRYGFIHGNRALDNSLGGKFCGVNNEIEILRKTGCYADFTFPGGNRANPVRINSIFYARDNPSKPKSYTFGLPVKRYGKKKGDLMIIQGPLYPGISKTEKKYFGIRMLEDEITVYSPVTGYIIDLWITTGIHVRGKRDWIFIKVHTHGAVEANAVLGKQMDYIHSYLETKYNDGYNYVLHYVTARELYNIIKAIEAGESGSSPELYRNYRIQPPRYDSTSEIPEASNKLKSLIAKSYKG